MNSKQRNTWTLIMLLLMAIACATSWIDQTQGARTLMRVAVAVMVVISIREFWNGVPTISRQQARINKIQRKHARG